MKVPRSAHACTDLVLVIERVVNSTVLATGMLDGVCMQVSYIYTHVYTRCVFSGEVNQEISSGNRFTQFEVCLMHGSDDQPAGR